MAPSSAPILVIVPLSGTESVLTPWPEYSNILFTPPLTVNCFNTSSIISLAEEYLFNLPLNSTFTICGIIILYSPPAMATATSSPPAPIASIPIPPQVGVWLSEPRSVSPGTENLSK